MLAITEHEWKRTARPDGKRFPAGKGQFSWETTASGLDLTLEFRENFFEDWGEMSGSYLVQTVIAPWTKLRRENQRALRLLDEWMAEPDELGEMWWRQFEDEQSQNRMIFNRFA